VRFAIGMPVRRLSKGLTTFSTSGMPPKTASSCADFKPVELMICDRVTSPRTLNAIRIDSSLDPHGGNRFRFCDIFLHRCMIAARSFAGSSWSRSQQSTKLNG
jgi:hypothetical protein